MKLRGSLRVGLTQGSPVEAHESTVDSCYMYADTYYANVIGYTGCLSILAVHVLAVHHCGSPQILGLWGRRHALPLMERCRKRFKEFQVRERARANLSWAKIGLAKISVHLFETLSRTFDTISIFTRALRH